MIERVFNAGVLLALFGWLFLFAACLWMIVGCAPYGPLSATDEKVVSFTVEVTPTDQCSGVSVMCKGTNDSEDQVAHPGDVSPGENLSDLLKITPQ